MRAFGLLALPGGGAPGSPSAVSPPYLSVTPTGATELVLVNGTAVDGYAMLPDETTLGDVVWDQAEGAPVGMLGASVVSMTPQNRAAAVAIRVTGTTADEFASRLAALERAVEDLRTRGGVVSYRKWGQALPMRTHLRVLACQVATQRWGDGAERLNRATVTLNLTAAPFVEGDGAWWSESFDEDGFATGEWVVGSGSAPTIANGYLRPTSTSAALLIGVGPGYVYGDVEVDVAYTPAGTTGIVVGALLRCKPGDEAGTHILATIDQAGNLRIQRRIGGVVTTLQAAAGAALAAGNRYWIRARAHGNTITCDAFYLGTGRTYGPLPFETPTTTVTHHLDAVDAGRFYSGRVGLHLDPSSTSCVVDAWRVAPVAASVAMPDAVPVRMAHAGTVPSRVDLDVECYEQEGDWGAVAWSAFDGEPNLCPNGDFVQGTVSPWTTTALAGFSVASTSITYTAVGRYQNWSGKIVTPGGVADQGARCPLPTRFHAGRFYLATGWLRRWAGVEPAYLRLGVGASKADSQAGGRVLTASWAFHAALWQPAATTSGANVGANVASTSLQELLVDGVCVSETVPVALLSDPGSGGTTLSLDGQVPAEWPDAPFLAVVEPGVAATELVLVTEAVTGASSITVARGMETTTAAAHAAGTAVCPVAPRVRFQGGGAPAPFGSFEASQLGRGSLTSGGTVTTVSTATAGQGTVSRIATAGAGVVSYLCPVDATALPDDGAETADVEVYVPLYVDTGVVGLTVTAVTTPFSDLIGSGEAYSAEFGELGAPVTSVSVDAALVTVFAGTVAVPRVPHATIVVRLAWAVGSTENVDVDEVVLIPAASRAAGFEAPPTDSYVYESWSIWNGRRVHSDLTGLQLDATHGAWGDDVPRGIPAVPLGGAPVEPPVAAKVRWMAWQGAIPNVQSAPTKEAGAGDERHERTTTLRLYQTPRWGRLRDA